MTYARKFPTSFRIQKGAYHDLHTGNAGPDKPGAGSDGVPDGQAPQEGAQGAAGAEKAGGGGGLSAQPGAIRKAALRWGPEGRQRNIIHEKG